MSTTLRGMLRFALPAMMLAACTLGPNLAQAQMTSTGIDCSQISTLHLLQQENMRAGLALMECGVIPRPDMDVEGDALTNDAPQPPNVLVSNRTCTSGSSCTKSESMVYKSTRPTENVVVVNYNDHNGNNYSGTSYSTDGGATFTEILPPPFANGHGTNYGDPIVVFNSKLNKWFAGDLTTGCGGQGIGLWTSPDGINWTAGACAHNSGADDRESLWVDNNPYSKKYGRMYISFGNYQIGVGALQLVYSDDGTTWTTVTISNTNTFIRDVQVTGSPVGAPPPSTGYTSTVFVAGMDEGGGGLASRQNIMFRSIDGGVTWTSATMGPRFNAPGDGTCSSNPYFADVAPIWRHMGWGEPGVGSGNVVHYVYAGQGQAANDHGDIYYVRSTDNGSTWSAPIKLNDDPGGQYKTQWMPSLSVNYDAIGTRLEAKVTVSWYDRRQATSACTTATDPGCSYYRYGVQSADNGATWAANIQISDQLIPQPTQNDGGVQPCYAGDYDYATAQGEKAFVTWTDGRVAIGGVQVQNVEFAVVPEP
jgi:hypothetical protein